MAASISLRYPLETMPACPHSVAECPAEQPCAEPEGWPDGVAPRHRCYKAWVGWKKRHSFDRNRAVPCLPFLARPRATLRDPQRWPDHYCIPVAVYLLGQWCREQWGFEPAEWPLPLHPEQQPRSLLRADALRYALGELPLFSRPLGSDDPYDPACWTVSVAFSVPLLHGRIDFLGLAYTDRTCGVQHGPLAVLVQGGALAVPEAVDYIQHARRWWARFQAHGSAVEAPDGMGRPRGGTLDSYTLEELRNTFRSFRNEWCRNNDGQPSMAVFACSDTIAVDPSVLKDHLRDKHGMTWLQFVAYCR